MNTRTPISADAGAQAEYAPFEKIADAFGLSRSRQYDLLVHGKIRAVRCGKRTLIEVASVREFMRSLPPAGLRPFGGAPIRARPAA